MAASRARKTFKYVSDADLDDDDLDTDAMDEEEQHKLITGLQQHNKSMNDIYIRAFTFLPLFATLPFLFSVVNPRSIGAVRLLCLLGTTSLCGSAFQMWFVPMASEGKATRVKVRRIQAFDVQIDEDGPLGRSIPYLNMGICGLLLISAWGVRGRSDVPEGFWILLVMPTVILAMISWARQSMSGVDNDLVELDMLKYNYKGA